MNLDLFHAIGKVLYCKRTEDIEEMKFLHLKDKARCNLVINPGTCPMSLSRWIQIVNKQLSFLPKCKQKGCHFFFKKVTHFCFTKKPSRHFLNINKQLTFFSNLIRTWATCLNPEELLENIPMSSESFTAFLHQSYADFFTSIKDLSNAVENLSFSDPFFNEWTVSNIYLEQNEFTNCWRAYVRKYLGAQIRVFAM